MHPQPIHNQINRLQWKHGWLSTTRWLESVENGIAQFHKHRTKCKRATQWHVCWISRRKAMEPGYSRIDGTQFTQSVNASTFGKKKRTLEHHNTIKQLEAPRFRTFLINLESHLCIRCLHTDDTVNSRCLWHLQLFYDQVYTPIRVEGIYLEYILHTLSTIISVRSTHYTLP